MSEPTQYVTLSEVGRELIADAGLNWWSLLSFIAEDCADQAEAAAAERGWGINRTSAVATGTTRLFDDPVYDAYRKGDGVIRIAWPLVKRTIGVDRKGLVER